MQVSAPVIFDVDRSCAEEYRFWQGCPTVMLSPKGRLYLGWYNGGTGEPSPFNYNLLIRSDDGGQSWSDPLLVIESLPELKIRAIDIQLWLDPQARAWLFWVQRDDNFPDQDHRHLSVWAITSDNIDDDTPVWSKPRFVSEGFIRSQPTVLKDGRWLLFAYDWTNEFYNYSESSDQGKSWQRRQGGKKLPTPFDEGMAVELNDKRLWLLARSTVGKLAESFSSDGGKTWSDGAPSQFTAPSARLFLKRLKSGNLLLVCSDSPDTRTDLTAFLSTDDGKSWPYRLLIDPGNSVSYPDGAEGGNSEIYLVHDVGRTSDKIIRLARITEKDIMAGRLVTPGSFVKRVVSQAPAKPYDEILFHHQRAVEQERFPC